MVAARPFSLFDEIPDFLAVIAWACWSPQGPLADRAQGVEGDAFHFLIFDSIPPHLFYPVGQIARLPKTINTEKSVYIAMERQVPRSHRRFLVNNTINSV